jgi:hypothetical protein
MNYYLQYNNVQKEELPIADPPFSITQLSIHTRRPEVQKAEGRVFLIAGVGRHNRIYSCTTTLLNKH